MPVRVVLLTVWLLPLSVSLFAQGVAGRAYDALKALDLPLAVGLFRQAVAEQQSHAGLRKDLAYTLLKVGEREEARDQFAEALRLDPADDRTALEYAFLCYETRREVQARRTFDRLRLRAATPETRAAAAQAFENIDRPLREGIARWQSAIQAAPGHWSAHEELARLAEQRDELDLAAREYAEAWRLRPDNRKLMLDLGRVWKEQGRAREATALLLAASRSGEPRVAESAKELLPGRYPYAYEFAEALDLDPTNIALRREYAFFLLELKRPEEAKAQFAIILKQQPEDDVSRRQVEQSQPPSARSMGLRSLEKSYLNDAVRYFRAAVEEDPRDAEAMLFLGRAYNQLGDDSEALHWLNRARRAGSREAAADYRNLRSTSASFRVTTWVLPMYSSRWSNGLFYGQVKGEWKVKSLPVRPYVSLRMIGDTQGDATHSRVNPLYPAYLSETAAIFGFGLAAPLKHGFYLWGEAGQAVSYLGRRTDTGMATPDYRGGVSWLRGWGHGVAASESGWVAESGFDTVFVSRFHNNVLTYAQSRAGYTFAGRDGAWHLQALWNGNFTFDRKREYWANFVEAGPGIRFRFRGLPPAMVFRADLLRGAFFFNRFNPLGPGFWDVRAGVWYAFTR